MKRYTASSANSAPAGRPMPSIFFHKVKFGFQSVRTNLKYESAGRKYSVSQTVANATEISVEIAAPATPYGRCVTQPKIRNGARIMFRITEAVDTIMPGLKFPVPRSAAPIATIANWRDIAEMKYKR